MKLHLGCGADHLDGYLNVDGRDDLGAVDLVCDVMDLREHVVRGSVTEIVSKDFIEHLSWQRWDELFDLFKYLLAPNGRMIHVVPNAMSVVRAILTGDVRFAEQYGCGLQTGNETWDVHKALWWPKMAVKMFVEAGFVEVEATDDEKEHFVLKASKR